MKIINIRQFEKLKIKPVNVNILKPVKAEYVYFPSTKHELISIIRQRIKEEGHECNLNDIDTSKITNMSKLISDIDREFNGDISEWNVSNVKTTDRMFLGCKKFKGDLSKWNTESLQIADYMFFECEKFNSDISKWNVKVLYSANYMFYNCGSFNQNLNDWDVNTLICMDSMFSDCVSFNQPLDKWGNKLHNVQTTYCMFLNCTSFCQDISSWSIKNINETKRMFTGCSSMKLEYFPHDF